MRTVWIVLIVIAVILIPVLVYAVRGMGEIKKMMINQVDLSKIGDGVYKGSFHLGRFSYEAEVTVRDHRIIAITTPKAITDSGRSKIVDGAIERIIDKQSPDIDVVSGATMDTKAFQKAVENALTAGVGGE